MSFLHPETNHGEVKRVFYHCFSVLKNLHWCTAYTVAINVHRAMSHHCFAFLFEYYKSVLCSCIHLRQQKLMQPSLYLNTHSKFKSSLHLWNSRWMLYKLVLIVLWSETSWISHKELTQIGLKDAVLVKFKFIVLNPSGTFQNSLPSQISNS